MSRNAPPSPHGNGVQVFTADSLSDDVGQFLEDFAGDRDSSGVRRKTSLGDDQLGKFQGHVDVGGFKLATTNGSAGSCQSGADLRVSAVGGCLVVILAPGGQTLSVDEIRNRQLGDRNPLTIGGDTFEQSVLRDAYRNQVARWKAVLFECGRKSRGQMAQFLKRKINRLRFVDRVKLDIDTGIAKTSLNRLKSAVFREFNAKRGTAGQFTGVIRELKVASQVLKSCF